MSRQPWRFRCPHDHTDWHRRRERNGAESPIYCGTCAKYGHDPHYQTLRDAVTGETIPPSGLSRR